MKKLLLGLVLALAPVMAAAQSLGVQFGQMPVGTKIYYEAYDGDEWVDTYVGKKGKFHVLERKIVGDNFNYKLYYNEEGHLERRRYSGFTVRYTPFNCEQVIGTCAHRYNGNPKYNGVYNYKQTQKGGKTYLSRVNTPSDSETFDKTVVFGKYNLIVEEKWTTGSKDRWVKVVKIQ